jgi:hypothetical protein
LFACCALFDHDDLATPIEAAAWANVVWSLHLTAIPASNQVDGSDEIVSASITLPMPANSLLGKRAHNLTPVLLVVTWPKQ